MFLFVLIYGLLIGSFLNVCIYRIPKEESIAFPASNCTECKMKLKWYDNVPLVSYLALGGKCRFCRQRISFQYPLVEFLNTGVYLLMFLYFGFSINFVFYSLISSILIVITFIDLKEMIIPDSLVVLIILLSVIHKSLNYFINGISPQILSSILGLVLAGGLFLTIVILSNGGMGGGDVTLIGSLGFVLGFKKIFMVVFLSFILGAVISLVLLATKIKTRKDPIPFGPFIVLSFFITLLWGEGILSWYMSFL